MVDIEPLIVSGLDRLLPLPGGERADWGEVLAAAGVKPRPRVTRRRLTLAVACLVAATAVMAATPVGAAIGHGIGSFSTWLSGLPGKPSSPAEQQAFDRATRSWAGFPHGTSLRRLVQTQAGGATFTLYGFRGAGSLCLRLVVSGTASARMLACPPLTALRGSPQPAFVVAADYGVGVNPQAASGLFPFATPRAAVTFGVVADGVQRVDVARSDGTARLAVIAGNAFLAVDTNPPATRRVAHIWATAGSKRVEITFTPAATPFSSPQTSGPHLSAHGPATVQRVIHGGSIVWLARREPRGIPVPERVHKIAGTLPDVIFRREIVPAPSAPERMVVSVRPAGAAYFGGRLRNKLQVCAELIGGRFGAGGCWPAGRLFSTAPFTLGVEEGRASQYVTIAGLASDDVAKLTLYLGTGKLVKVPLHDNGYVVQAAKADYPVRLVAYDSHGRVIGIKTLQTNAQQRVAGPQPAANAPWRRLLRNNIGEVFVARSTRSGTCYAIRVGIATSGPSCKPPPTAHELQVGVGWSNRGGEITGRTGSTITRLVVHLRNGHTQTIAPIKGYILVALPPTAGPNPNANPVRSITALDAHGHVIAQPQNRLTGGSGTITHLTPSSIAIGAHAPACRRTANSPSLSGYRVGMHVQYLCHNGVLSLIGRSPSNKQTTWATRTVRSEGPITALTRSKISLQNTNAQAGTPAATVTCSLTGASPKTAGYHITERIHIFCSHGKLTGINRDPTTR